MADLVLSGATLAMDFTSPVGRVRLLIADIDANAPVFADEHLEGYLGLNSGNEYRAAADALDAMATTDVLLSRKIRTQDLQTDGPAVAKDLRAQAAVLRGKADAAEEADGSFFEVVPFTSSFSPEGAEYRYP